MIHNNVDIGVILATIQDETGEAHVELTLGGNRYYLGFDEGDQEFIDNYRSARHWGKAFSDAAIKAPTFKLSRFLSIAQHNVLVKAGKDLNISLTEISAAAEVLQSVLDRMDYDITVTKKSGQ